MGNMKRLYEEEIIEEAQKQNEALKFEVSRLEAHVEYLRHELAAANNLLRKWLEIYRDRQRME
jgi:predicted nuclease with TOPRIM domain